MQASSSIVFNPKQTWPEFAQNVKGLVSTNRKLDAANLCLQAADYVHNHPELFPDAPLAWMKFEWGFRSSAARYDPKDENLIDANRLTKKIAMMEAGKIISAASH